MRISILSLINLSFFLFFGPVNLSAQTLYTFTPSSGDINNNLNWTPTGPAPNYNNVILFVPSSSLAYSTDVTTLSNSILLTGSFIEGNVNPLAVNPTTVINLLNNSNWTVGSGSAVLNNSVDRGGAQGLRNLTTTLNLRTSSSLSINSGASLFFGNQLTTPQTTGTVSLNSGNSTDHTTSITNNGTFDLTQNTISSTINNFAIFTNNGAINGHVSGNVPTFNNGIGGTLINNAGGTITNINLTSSSLSTIVNSGSISPASGAFTNNGDFQNNGSFTGNINNNGSLESGGFVNGSITNSGTVFLNGGNVSGSVTNNSGATLSSSGASLGSLQNLGTTTSQAGSLTTVSSLQNGSTLNHTASFINIGGITVTNGTIDNYASFQNSTPLTIKNFNNYSQGLLNNSSNASITVTTLSNDNGGQINNSGVINNSLTFTNNGVFTQVVDPAVSGSATFNGNIVNNGSINSNGVINGAITNNGSVQTSGANNGFFTNNAGASLSANGASFSLDINNQGNAVLNNTRMGNFSTITNGSTTNHAASLTTNGITNSTNSGINNFASFQNNAPLIINNINNHAQGVVNNSSNASITLSSLLNADGGQINNSGVINDSSTFTNNGLFTQFRDPSVSGSATYNGNIINNGTIISNGTQNGTLTNNGVFLPGDAPGLATVSAYNGTGTLMVNILNGGSPVSGQMGANVVNGADTSSYSVLRVTSTAPGSIDLSGQTLQVSLLDNFVPTIGEIFDIVDYSSLLNPGTFANLILPPGLWLVTYNNTSPLNSYGGNGYDAIFLTYEGLVGVPEPSIYVLLASGLGLAALLRARRLVKAI